MVKSKENIQNTAEWLKDISEKLQVEDGLRDGNKNLLVDVNYWVEVLLRHSRLKYYTFQCTSRRLRGNQGLNDRELPCTSTYSSSYSESTPVMFIQHIIQNLKKFSTKKKLENTS